MKFLTFLWEKIKNVLKDSFLLSFGIAFFNFIPYGINKYFSKTYLDLLFFINSLKFFIYFIIFLVIILGISFILSFLNKKVKNCILKSLFFISLIFLLLRFF